MNILVIGNGFDLAHGLPTKYEHFLEFIKLFTDTYKRVKDGTIDWKCYDTKKEVGNFLKRWFGAWNNNENGQSEKEKKTTVKIIEELESNIKDNVWIEYFLQCDMYQKGNWIDFESEISKIVQSLDNDMKVESGKDFNFDETIGGFSNEFLNKKFSDYNYQNAMIESWLDSIPQSGSLTYREIRDTLLNDLNKLTRALEICLTEYVEELTIKKISPDIQSIRPKGTAKLSDEPVYDAYVLCFNYTNTYQRLYVDKSKAYFDQLIHYIHGKAKSENTIQFNNMVLGIDEYLSKKRRDKDTEFIAFKKYYQRIYKGTGSKYKEWVDKIKESWENESIEGKAEIRKCIISGNLNSDKIHKLYIFGHSLDETDKDVLRDLILNDNVYTTIFYHNKEELGRKIANLVKVIGQDELIRRTGGSTRTIEFKLQQPMVERESD